VKLLSFYESSFKVYRYHPFDHKFVKSQIGETGLGGFGGNEVRGNSITFISTNNLSVDT